MRILHGEEEQQALEYITLAADVAKKATCERSRCGSIIVIDNQIIGEGYNSPPNEDENQRRCEREKASYHIKVTDKTCCIHAEQRSIMDALKTNPDKIIGSSLYFVRLNEEGEPMQANEPYCTICSKMALDSGVSEFVLWHDEGITVYDTKEYNLLSFEFGKIKD
jgi:deoxycytidylate deaminase